MKLPACDQKYKGNLDKILRVIRRVEKKQIIILKLSHRTMSKDKERKKTIVRFNSKP